MPLLWAIFMALIVVGLGCGKMKSLMIRTSAREYSFCLSISSAILSISSALVPPVNLLLINWFNMRQLLGLPKSIAWALTEPKPFPPQWPVEMGKYFYWIDIDPGYKMDIYLSNMYRMSGYS